MVGALVGTPVPLRPHPLAAGSDDDFGYIWYSKACSRREKSDVPSKPNKIHHKKMKVLTFGALKTQAVM